MISEEVRKYKGENKKDVKYYNVSLSDVEQWLGMGIDEELDHVEFEQEYEKRVKIIEKAIDGNDDMEAFFIMTMENKTYDEICQELGWEKSKVYKVSEKLKGKVIDYIKQK